MPQRKSSSRKGQLVASVVLLASGASLGGCADYMERRDTITLHAGEAQAWNRVVHTSDPWPPYVMDTRIPGDGQRTEVVMRRYSTGNAEAGSIPAPSSAGSAGAPQQ
jgi:hypothetical protein